MIFCVSLQLVMGDCSFNEDSSTSVCGSIWVISVVESIVWNVDVAFGSKVRFADEENVDVLFL
jgi:hypothetical protein